MEANIFSSPFSPPPDVHTPSTFDRRYNKQTIAIASKERASNKACPFTGAERVSLVQEDPKHPELFEYIEEGSQEFGDAM